MSSVGRADDEQGSCSGAGATPDLVYTYTLTQAQHVTLAVTTAKRIPALPDVPTVAEAGVPGYDVVLWHGLIGPKGMPKEIVARVNAEATKALKLKETAQQLQNDGVAPAGGTPEEFGATIKKEIAMWRKVVTDAGVKVE